MVKLMKIRINSWRSNCQGRVFEAVTAAVFVVGASVSSLWGGLVDRAIDAVGVRVAVKILIALSLIMAAFRWASKGVRAAAGADRAARLGDGFEMVRGELPPGGFEVSCTGNILCPLCGSPMRLSACHARMDALVNCGPCGVIALADRTVNRLREEAARVAKAPQGHTAGPGHVSGILRPVRDDGPDAASGWRWN